MQEVISYIILAFAIYFLGRKFIFKSKKNKKDCDSDCGCA